jgi:hypothetical protein
MSHYITDTEAQAQAQEVADFAEFQAAHGTQPASYWLVTTAWSIPRERLDGKWIRAVCPNSTATGRTIETDPKDGTWFPVDDITP